MPPRSAALPCLLAALSLALGDLPAQARPRRDRIAEQISRLQETVAALGTAARDQRRRGRLYEKIGDLERRRERPRAARQAYRQALAAYAAAGQDQRRLRLLGRLARPGRRWARKTARPYAELRDAWRSLQRLERRVRRLPRRAGPPAKPDPRLPGLRAQATEIREVARRRADTELRARALGVAGRLAAAAGDPAGEVARFREGARLCRDQVCPRTWRRLLAAAASRLERAGELAEAFRLQARLNAAATALLSPERRRYARSKGMIRVCAKLHALPDSPTCRSLEQQAVGHVTYRDFSRGRPRPELSEDEIREVHAEYLPLLTDCLLAAARAEEATPGDTFELSWTITNDGRTVRLEIDPPLEGEALGRCFAASLEVFRYPRFRGERRNVIVPLAVSQPPLSVDR